MYQQVATAGQATPQAISLLLRSSPASVASRMDAPTLLIQGEHDSLFGLDQANANYQAIRRNGAPADMVWFAGGHDGGDQETGRVNALTAAWFHRWLDAGPRPRAPPPGQPAPSGEPATGQPGFAVTRVLGFDPTTGAGSLGVATARGLPGPGRDPAQTAVRLAGPAQAIVHPPGGAPPSMSVFARRVGAAGPGSGLTFDMPGQSAAFTSAPLTAPLQVTGPPTVRIRVSGARQVTLFAKVYDVDQAGNATLPVPARRAAAGDRRGGAAGDVTVTLPAIDYDFAAGHRLRLVLTTTDFGYATPPPPAVYQVALAGPGRRGAQRPGAGRRRRRGAVVDLGGAASPPWRRRR